MVLFNMILAPAKLAIGVYRDIRSIILRKKNTH